MEDPGPRGGELEATGDLRDLLLKRLWSQRTSLNVRFPGHGETFVTSILRLVPKTQHLYLDEFNPDTGQQQLLQHRELELRGHFKGIDIRMRAQLEAMEHLDGIALYCMRIPEQLFYHQKRDAFRVRIPHDWATGVNIELSDHQQLQGRLTDISFLGFRCSFHTPHRLTLDDAPYSAELFFPNSTDLSLTVQLRHLDYDDEGNCHVGVRFLDLDYQDERTLAQMIRSVERYWLQQRTFYFDEEDQVEAW